MFDELRDKLCVYAKRTGETVSMLGTVMLAAPLAVVIAFIVGTLFSNAGVGFISFFIALAVFIVWLREDAN